MDAAGQRSRSPRHLGAISAASPRDLGGISARRSEVRDGRHNGLLPIVAEESERFGRRLAVDAIGEHVREEAELGEEVEGLEEDDRGHE